MSTVRYSGMNASSGHAITDNEHIAQSIGDILLTPIGSRVMRRAYGSQLFNLIDQPVDNEAARYVCHLQRPVFMGTADLSDQYHPERAGCRSAGCHYPGQSHRQSDAI